MKANQLATLVLRLLGIYCLIQIVPTVVALSTLGIIAQTIEHSDNSNVMTFVQASIPSICWFVIAVLLFVFSIPWGKKLTKDLNEASITTISFEQVQILAFAVAGILIFAEALPQLLNSVSSFFISLNQVTSRNQYPPNAQFNWRDLLAAVGIFLKAALGLWMFFGARGFTNLWRSLRNFGTPKPPEN
jgi:hypothetical protein